MQVDSMKKLVTISKQDSEAYQGDVPILKVLKPGAGQEAAMVSEPTSKGTLNIASGVVSGVQNSRKCLQEKNVEDEIGAHMDREAAGKEYSRNKGQKSIVESDSTGLGIKKNIKKVENYGNTDKKDKENSQSVESCNNDDIFTVMQ